LRIASSAIPLILLEIIMEILSFLDPSSGKLLYCIGPFSDKAAASRASAGLPNAPASRRKRPQGPITKRCWDIFDLLADKQDRGGLIAECERQGILRGTAVAQYSRWKNASERG
jgi:hypothetical protein